MTQSSETTINMYVPQMDAVLNAWFTNYEEALASLKTGGGYLLPYKGQSSSPRVKEFASWDLIHSIRIGRR